MIDFILLLVLTSTWCFGFRALFQPDMILEKVGDWMWDKSEFVSKPLFQCPPCMASIHGSIAFILFNDFFILQWIAFCICLCGLNYLITKIALE